MTVIECFTDSHIDNISACLRLQPEKVIMVGCASQMQIPVERYQHFLQNRGQHTQILLSDTEGKDFPEICHVLYRLALQEEDCVIDLTGGDERIIMAVGAVMANLSSQQRQHIQIQKYDHQAEVLLDCMNENAPIPSKMPTLTVEELITLHGGSLYPKATELPADCNHKDVDQLWHLVTVDPKSWNRSITLLNEFESRSDSKMQIFVPLYYLRHSIKDFEAKTLLIRELLDKLHRWGVIINQSDDHALNYTYRSPLLRYCTLKAGNVLEVKTLLAGRAALEQGKPFFQNCAMSVSIDWDGVIHGFADRVVDTRNEIDVILMHGTTPLFISCKNGNVGEEELYKLSTVADRFGGPHVRKMLIATELDSKNLVANQQRAWDMDIVLIPNAADLSQEELQRRFVHALK